LRYPKGWLFTFKQPVLIKTEGLQNLSPSYLHKEVTGHFTFLFIDSLLINWFLLEIILLNIN